MQLTGYSLGSVRYSEPLPSLKMSEHCADWCPCRLMQKLPLTCISFGLGLIKAESAQQLGGSGAVCEVALCSIEIKDQRC